MIGAIAASELLDRPLRGGDGVQWRFVHPLLVDDEPQLQWVRRLVAADVEALGFGPHQVKTFVFSEAYLEDVVQRHLNAVFDAEDAWPSGMSCVVAVGLAS